MESKIINENGKQNDNPYVNNKNDRVLIVLDVRNITAREGQDYCNICISYPKLLQEIVRDRNFVAAIAVDSLITNEYGKDSAEIFHRNLKNSNFRLELVPNSNNKGKQDGVDVKIALIAQKYALEGKCDVVELITGDGDFNTLVDSLHEEGVKVIVTSYNKSLSYSLRDKVDGVRILDDIPLIKMNPKTIDSPEAA